MDLTSPVAAIQLAAGAFFLVKMTTQDLTSPVAAIQLAAGAFFPVKMTTHGFDKPFDKPDGRRQEKFGAPNSTGGLGSTSKPVFWRAAT